MSKTATLKGKISLDDTEFQKTIRRATDRAKKFGSDVASSVGNVAKAGLKAGLIGLGAAGVGAGAGLLAAAKAAADLGGQLSDAAAITGISASKMLVLQQAFTNAGMSGEGTAGVIAKLQASIGRAGILSEETEEEISGLRDRMEELQSLKFNGGFDPQAAASMRKEITKLRKMLAEEPNRVLKNQINEQITDLEQSLKQGIDPKDAANIDKEIKKVQDRIKELESDAKGVAKAFKMLGLDQGQLAGMDGADQLLAMFEAVGRLENQSDKMAALRMLRLPPDLMVLAKDPNAFKDAATQLGTLPGIMDEFAGKFDRVSDIANAKFGILFKQIGAGFLKEIVDNETFQAFLSKFEKLDLSFIGEKIGQKGSAIIDFIAATLEQGNISETFSAVLEIGITKAMQIFVEGMEKATALASAVFATVFSGDGYTFVSNFGKALAGVVIFAAFQFFKVLEAGWISLQAKFNNSSLGKAMGVGQAATGVMKSTFNTAAHVLSLGQYGDYYWDQAKQGFNQTGQGLLQAFDGEDPMVTEARKNAALNQKMIPGLNMTESQLLDASLKSLKTGAESVQPALEQLRENFNRFSADLDTASRSVEAEANKAMSRQMVGEQGGFSRFTDRQRESFGRILGEGQQVQPNAIRQPVKPQPPQTQWTFPNQSNNKQSSSDTKQVSLLEQTVALLERNLTAMQVA
jgi:hypothetical protein